MYQISRETRLYAMYLINQLTQIELVSQKERLNQKKGAYRIDKLTL